MTPAMSDISSGDDGPKPIDRADRAVRRPRAIGPGAAGWEAPRAFDVDELEVSEDTDGSMPPPSPTSGDGFGLDDERAPVEPQVTTCRWQSCAAGNIGNMDLLVEHIHEEHIHARQKKYTCEWDGCGRKGFSHASAYALRAHMRSHTKEKPFYCSLPECDRSFTRSDALAKHMRTIHETEPAGPSTRQARGAGTVAPADASAPAQVDAHSGAEPDKTEPELTPEELALGPAELFSQLTARLEWAMAENERLLAEDRALEEKVRREWAFKECVFDKAMERELDSYQRRLESQGRLDDPLSKRVLSRMRADLDMPPAAATGGGGDAMTDV